MRRQVFNNLFFSYANYATTIVAPLVLVPLFVRLLGHTLYGEWLVILSLTSYFSMANLGLSRTLANEYAMANARADLNEIDTLTSTSFFGYGAVTALLLGIFLIKLPAISTHFLAYADRATIVALVIVAVCSAVALPFDVYAMLLRGVKRVDQEQAIGAFSTVGRVAAMTAALAAGLRILAVAVIQGGIRVIGAIASCVYAIRISPEARPRIRKFSLSMMRRLIVPSAGFFAIQIAQTINVGLDNLVIAAFRPAAEVTQYAVAMKLVFINSGIFSVILDTLAPYVTADFTLQRSDRLQTGYILFLKFAFLFGVTTTMGLWFLGPGLMQFWAGPGIFPGKATFALQTSLLLMGIIANPAYIVLTSTMRHYGLTVVAAVECTLNLTLSIWLVQRWGIAGVIAGSVFAHVLTNAWYMQYGALQVLRIEFSRVVYEIGPIALLSLIVLGIAFAFAELGTTPLSGIRALISTIIAVPAFAIGWALVSFDSDERKEAWSVVIRFIHNRGQARADFAG
ncbi:MAG TPA: oligosaccharide flippase family protein [Candidatus Binataceae bacterium]|nr:oligosaccharide flippase family protein [Candidatus Binataceae bacterium]